MKSIAVIAGARPNFMKVAPILRAFDRHPTMSSTLIHTGQHYDKNLSNVFFDELEIREPDIRLQCEGKSHAQQTANILTQLENVFISGDPVGRPFTDVLVVGDVNSTLAATLAAAKLGIRVSHVEAGLRSFDRTMPEEINRLMTDAVADLLFVSEPEGMTNLKREGHPDERIHLVGNVMIDTLFHKLTKSEDSSILSEHDLAKDKFALVTLHRPSNVDDRDTLQALLQVLLDVSRQLKIVFPVHPRTRNRLLEFGLLEQLSQYSQVTLLEPLGYLDLLMLNKNARVVITDSGGLQEETTALLTPCLTLRKNTERPVTVSEGTSTLIGNDPQLLADCLQQILQGNYKTGVCPALWDGHAAERIADVLVAAP